MNTGSVGAVREGVGMAPQSVPRPPRDIWDEMAAAGAAGDDLRLAVAHEHYVRWLEANGYHVPHGTSRPDEAIR